MPRYPAPCPCAFCNEWIEEFPPKVQGRFCSPRCEEEFSKRTIWDRFAAQVGPTTKSGCTLWFGGTNTNGYGMISGELAHRVSWELNYGPIPRGVKVLHTCDTPRCVNAEHLFLGSNFDNMRDRTLKGRAAKKLSPDKVHQIRKLFAEARSKSSLAKEFGVGRSTIQDIISGKIWWHV